MIDRYFFSVLTEEPGKEAEVALQGYLYPSIRADFIEGFRASFKYHLARVND